jgi:hypothetical protein
MNSELARDFNYILYYFGISNKIYTPTKEPYSMLWKGSGRAIFIDLDLYADEIKDALEGLYYQLQNDKLYYHVRTYHIEYFR